MGKKWDYSVLRFEHWSIGGEPKYCATVITDLKARKNYLFKKNRTKVFNAVEKYWGKWDQEGYEAECRKWIGQHESVETAQRHQHNVWYENQATE